MHIILYNVESLKRFVALRGEGGALEGRACAEGREK